MQGLPAYTTAAGWLGYSEEKIVRLANQFMDGGFNAFKLKVGSNLEDDKRRLAIMRRTIGETHLLTPHLLTPHLITLPSGWERKLSTPCMTPVMDGQSALSNRSGWPM